MSLKRLSFVICVYTKYIYFRSVGCKVSLETTITMVAVVAMDCLWELSLITLQCSSLEDNSCSDTENLVAYFEKCWEGRLLPDLTWNKNI